MTLPQRATSAPPAPAPSRGPGRFVRETDALMHSVLGLQALLDAMADLGVAGKALLAGTGIDVQSISDSEARISHQQKIALFDNVRRLTPDPAVALLAGQRQRIADLGVFGYALLSSATFAEGLDFGMRHLRLAGPVLEKHFHVEGDVAIFSGHDVIDLGPLLPLATEFWFSSMQTLISHAIGQSFKATRLLLPYPAPAYASRYAAALNCPVEFDAPVMQWQFDAAWLGLPLPAANPVMAEVSAGFCARMLEDWGGENALVRVIQEACFNSVGGLPRLEQMAAQLHLSPRTLQRRLRRDWLSYQDILDRVRRRLAVEFLERTGLSVDEIAERTGFSDVSNFRKAFRKWTGHTPAHYRPRRG